ncbi:MAG: tyrosine-type recombinase/integrase [Desulfobulbaceae bacterium]|nr:tyrosine-type recombinase/integrase [Desulfobulbaceae bacterium]
MSEITQEQIQRLVQKYIRETLANDEQCRAMTGPTTSGTTTLEGKTLLESSDMKAPEARSLLESVNRWLRHQDHSLMQPVADRIIRREGLEVEQVSPEYLTFTRQLMKGFQSVLNVRIKRAEGDYSEADEELVPVLKQQVQPAGSERSGHSGPAESEQTDNPDQGLNFTEVQERYLEEIEKGGNWTEKTKAENLAIFALFVRVLGDLPVTKIDRKLMSEYKATLMKLPPNLNKIPKYNDMSVDEVIASKPSKTLTVTTINKYIRRLSGLFNYAARNGYMPVNPAEGMKIKTQQRADQEREAYTLEDLRKLFESEEFKKGKHPYCRWSPLIALYSGCRLEEICQMHLEDIRQEGGVWVFDINGKGDKRLKTKSSERLVPVHTHLIKLGLLDYVEYLKGCGEERLFPELRKRRDGYGQTVSKWFQRYKARCGIGQGKTFHSFRHTFVTQLKHKGVDPFMIHELDGHTIESESMGRYGKRYTSELLLTEAIQKVDYCVDIDHLINTHEVKQ